MSDRIPLADRSLSGLKKHEWLKQLAEIAEVSGQFEVLGTNHVATRIDTCPAPDGASGSDSASGGKSGGKSGSDSDAETTLLVTFETMQGIQLHSDIGQPLGWDMVRRRDWSHLCLISDGDTWFRDPHIYALFDRLTDEGYFEDFNRVLFYGAGPCGYAAAAYSVAAPGALVLAVQPQATLDPRVTEWDHRFSHMRRISFTDRYGYAPDMLDAAAKAFVLYDPAEDLDAMHAALFTRPNVTKLRLRHMGDALQGDLIEMDILDDLLITIAEDRLTQLHFARLARARREHPSYLRNLLGHLDVAHRPYLAMLMCRNVVERMHAPRIRRRLDGLEKSAAEGEFTPPPQRNGNGNGNGNGSGNRQQPISRL